MEPVILILDDNADLAMMMKKFIVVRYNDQYDVKIADHPEQAMQLIREALPSLIFLDLCLGPFGSLEGEEFIATLKELCPEASIVSMTAYRDEQLEARVKKRGIAKYLLKPLRGEMIEEAIHELIETSS